MVTQQQAVLRASELRCRLGERWVVDGVSLELQPADVIVVFGPNGAGKTSLIRLLAGALPVQQGQVFLGHQDVTSLPLHRRARAGIGYLAQSPSAFAGLSVWDNVAAVLQLHHRRSAEVRRRVERLLDSFGILALARQRAETLSGGERRRMELARLMALEPRVALLDEPFAGLDPAAASGLAEQVTRLAHSGVGVLVAEHHVQQALTIGRRACILVEGRVVAQGSAQELIDGGAFDRAFFGATSPDVGRLATAEVADHEG